MDSYLSPGRISKCDARHRESPKNVLIWLVQQVSQLHSSASEAQPRMPSNVK